MLLTNVTPINFIKKKKVKNMEKHFIEEDVQMVDKHMRNAN